MKPETRFGNAIRNNMITPSDRYDRIENSVSFGLPDTNMCLAGEDVWAELKAPCEPKRATTPLMSGNHPLLQSQMNWFKRQAQAGGIAFILARTDWPRTILIDGTAHGDEFNSWTLAQMLDHALWSHEGRMNPDQWKMLRNVLFTATRYRRLHRHARAQDLLNDLERGGVVGNRHPRR